MLPENSVLDEWLAQIACGDREALRALYEATKTTIYGYALSVVKRREDAEDILQDTYVTIFRSAASYHSQGKPMAWIYTIARNECLMRIRQGTRHVDLSDDEWAAVQVPSHDEQVIDRLALESAMTVLADDERQIVLMHALAGDKHREIAEVLSIPLSTVLSKYRRALEKIRTKLQEVSHGKA